jgi:hypothetical protein
LSAMLMSGRVDALAGQPAQMFVALLGINHMYGPVPPGKAFPDEWKQDTIFLFVVCKECTNVALFPELSSAKRNRLGSPVHRQSSIYV